FGLAGVAHRVQGGGPSGHAVHQLPAVEVQVAGGGEDGHGGAEVADERRLLAECHPADSGVHAVGPHDQVEAARLAALEGDLDAVLALADVGDGVVEEVLDVVAGGGVEDAGQVAAQGLDLGDGAARVAQEVEGHAGQPLVGGVDVGHAAGPGVGLADLVEDAHAVDDLAGRAPQVDRLAAGGRGGGHLAHGGVKAISAQPVGQRRPGDARAGDDDVTVLHRDLPAGSCTWVAEPDLRRACRSYCTSVLYVCLERMR